MRKILPDENNPKFICGRPLGMAFDTISENLIVIDTTSGIYELNLKNGEKKQILSEKAVFGKDVRNRWFNFNS